MEIVLLGLVTLNIAGLILMAYDKSRARRGQWRIKEATLFWVAACGGALGIWSGMAIFHHKTKHLSFVVGIPVIIALQVIIWFFVTKSGFVIK